MNADLLHQELELDEGCRLKPYRDSMGHLTVGVGHNLEANGISHDIAMRLLDEDLQLVVYGPLDHYLPWWRELPDGPARALANMTFNLGVGNILGFHQVLTHLQAHDFPGAAKALRNSRVFKQLPNRYTRLCKRIDPSFVP